MMMRSEEWGTATAFDTNFHEKRRIEPDAERARTRLAEHRDFLFGRVVAAKETAVPSSCSRLKKARNDRAQEISEGKSQKKYRSNRPVHTLSASGSIRFLS
jgi:hypothetical protein